MSDDDKGEETSGSEQDSLEQYSDWKERPSEDDDDPRELFRKANHIALCISYDAIDKLRWWEKETLKLDEDEVAKRLPHMSEVLDQLKTAYVTFSDIDF